MKRLTLQLHREYIETAVKWFDENGIRHGEMYDTESYEDDTFPHIFGIVYQPIGSEQKALCEKYIEHLIMTMR